MASKLENSLSARQGSGFGSALGFARRVREGIRSKSPSYHEITQVLNCGGLAQDNIHDVSKIVGA